jgi:hypothetical protein
MPDEEYKGKLHALRQSQIDRGFLYFTVTRGLALLLTYVVILICVLFFRGRSYVGSRHEGYWIASAILIVFISFGSAALNFYSLKRRITKL